MYGRTNNWSNKVELAEKAKKHTREMLDKYSEEIVTTIANTKVYDEQSKFTCSVDDADTVIEVLDADSVTAAYRNRDSKNLAVLNFASYKHPGGMFVDGSKAQEECLCHASFLYNVLKFFDDSFYAWNCRFLNNALYQNRALYSPDIIFCSNGAEFKCSVITCAAPNKRTAQKYGRVQEWKNSEALKSRIRFVLSVAQDNYVDTLILGAYGCGVFGQNPIEVAQCFKEALQTEFKHFKKVVFAIPDSTLNENYAEFKKVFE